MVYYYCAVPGCTSTTVKTPEKYFFTFPKNHKRRIKWFKAIRRSPKDLSMTTGCLKVCEDHFNLQVDLQNYVKYCLKAGQVHLLKTDVVPHIFDCQPDRPTAHSKKRRSVVEKRFRVQQLNEIFQEAQSTDPDIPKSTEEPNVPEEPVQVPENPEHVSHSTDASPTKQRLDAIVGLCMLSRATHRDKATQVQFCQQIRKSDAATQCQILKEIQREPSPSLSLSPTGDSIMTNSSGSWQVSGESSGSTASLATKNILLKKTLHVCKSKPMRYVGVPVPYLGLINILAQEIKCPERHIFIVLQKIRLNQSFGELGDMYELSESMISRIFCRNVGIIADALEDFVFWPPSATIKRALPISFRENFAKVQSIIDCFEIQIEQPSDPIKQTLTWSEYKKANTIKYLVSSTPNGFINFISKGYGGRISDMNILHCSGFLNALPRGCQVMADRGFKGVAASLEARGCSLVRPPSAAAGQKLTRLEVLHTRQIASLRIHIERVIRRLREFNFLKPHSCVNMRLIKYLDHVVQICASLVNIQSSLIKK